MRFLGWSAPPPPPSSLTITNVPRSVQSYDVTTGTLVLTHPLRPTAPNAERTSAAPAAPRELVLAICSADPILSHLARAPSRGAVGSWLHVMGYVSSLARRREVVRRSAGSESGDSGDEGAEEGAGRGRGEVEVVRVRVEAQTAWEARGLELGAYEGAVRARMGGGVEAGGRRGMTRGGRWKVVDGAEGLRGSAGREAGQAAAAISTWPIVVCRRKVKHQVKERIDRLPTKIPKPHVLPEEMRPARLSSGKLAIHPYHPSGRPRPGGRWTDRWPSPGIYNETCVSSDKQAKPAG